MKDYLREDLKTLKPYQASEENYSIKMDANESPYDIPETIRKALADELLRGSSLNLYPDSDANSLRGCIGDFLGIQKDNILIGAGSDELIQVIINAFVNKGDRVLCPTPSFGMYKIFTQVAGGVPVEFSLDDRFQYNIEKVLSMARQYTPKVLFLCTPNNPTGNTIPIPDIIAMVQGFDGIVVVDEAYADFSGESMIPYINDYPNLIILRTFSKAMGLAGLRIGYLTCNKELATQVYKVKPPYNINSLSQRAASLVLLNNNIIKKQVDQIVKSRDWLYNELKQIKDLAVYPTQANFILIRVDDGEAVYKYLLRQGILVRHFIGHSVLGNCLRITLGLDDENRSFLSHLKDALSNREE